MRRIIPKPVRFRSFPKDYFLNYRFHSLDDPDAWSFSIESNAPDEIETFMKVFTDEFERCFSFGEKIDQHKRRMLVPYIGSKDSQTGHQSGTIQVKLDLVGLNKTAVSMSALEDCIRNTISHRGWLEDPNPNLQNYYFKERKAAPAIMKEKKFFSFRFLDTGVINDYSIEIKASTLDDLEQFMRTFSANLQKYLTVVLRHPEDFDPRKIFMVERKIYSSGESAVIHLGPGDICSGKDFLTQKQVANYIQSTLKANGWNQEKPQKGDFNQYFKVTGG